MIKCIEFVNNFVSEDNMKLFLPKNIPINYKQLYNKECRERNLSLFLAVCISMFIFEILLLMFQIIRLGDVLYTLLYFDIYIYSIIFPFTFGILYLLCKKNIIIKSQYIVDSLFVIVFISIAALTTYAEITLSVEYFQNSLFIMLMFSVASFIYFDYKVVIAFLTISIVVFLSLVYFSQYPSLIKTGIMLDYLLLYVLNICVAIVFHNNRIEKFIQKVEIEIANDNLQKSNLELEKLNSQLEQTAITDALTGVLNRLAFNNILKTQVNFAIQNAEPMTVLMIDVDHFKLYNDTFGHLQGDECLKAVAKCIIKSLRKTGDFIFRYGGEEFACILPATDTKGAKLAASRIMEELRIAAIETSVKNEYLTVSIGIYSSTPTKDGNILDFVEKADKALYTSKNQGRGRYTIYNEL